MKEFEYLENLKRESMLHRRRCLTFVRKTFKIETDPLGLRRLSWTYSNRFPTIPKEHLDIAWPAPIATSYTDAYHHAHFIRAVLASLFCKEDPIMEVEVWVPNIITTEGDDLKRREAQALLYSQLASLIPEVIEEAKVCTDDTVKPNIPKRNQIVDDLKSIRSLVEEIHHAVVVRAPVEDMDPGADPGSKLRPKAKGRRAKSPS